MLHKWNVKELNNKDETCKENLSQELNINPILCKLLIQRGIRTYEEAKQFFRPKLSDIHDPFLLNDMDKAIDRLNDALGTREKILVYGDYDVDGTTAVALVYKFLQGLTSDIGYYIPNRYNEGYGISYKGIDYAVEHGYSLMIVLDCGIKAVEKVKYASEKGLDIIICDHHTPDDKLPEAVAVLDPKRVDTTYPYRHLSGCGVGFKLIQGFAQYHKIEFEKLIPLLDLLAVSIASDIVPITGENRVLMHFGLIELNTKPCTGMRAMLEKCKLTGRNQKTNISTSDIVFKIGPRINASGRMGSGNDTVDLLVAKDYSSAKEKSNTIDACNQERKDLDKQTTSEAKEFINNHEEDFNNRDSIVVYNPKWSKGVIGIVASRLSEKYYRPSIVMTFSNGFATGSARSISGFNIYKAIESCRDILENFGGHMYAAGLTLKEENIKEFTLRFDKYVSSHISEEQKIPQINIDSDLHFDEITPNFFTILKQFAPFGPENMQPTFATFDAINAGGSKLVGKNNEHYKLNLMEPTHSHRMNGIAFGKNEKYKAFEKHIKAHRPISICYTIEENNFNGSHSLQMMVKDMKMQ